MFQELDVTLQFRLSLPASVSINDLEARLAELVQEGFGSQLRVSGDSPKLLAAVDAKTKQPIRCLPLDDLLAASDQVAVLWESDDVLAVRPDLSDDQAWQVLQYVQHNHDASVGINWETLSVAASNLFGETTSTFEQKQ